MTDEEFSPEIWAARNQACLLGEFARLHALLGGKDTVTEAPVRFEEMPEPTAIDSLTILFKLSSFERDLLLLCAGVEMDPALGERCTKLTGHSKRGSVTFALAIGVLADAHWSALAPSSPLRKYRLIELEPGHGLTTAPLRIDERILHYLAGVNRMDARLQPLLSSRAAPVVTPEHWHLICATIADETEELAGSTVIHFFGDDPSGQENVGALVARRFDREVCVLLLEDIPPLGAELDQFIALWEREALLLPAFLLLQWEGETPTQAARYLAKRVAAPLFIATRTPLHLPRTTAQYEINKAAPAGQKTLWQISLGSAAPGLSGVVDQISEQFRLTAETIMSLGVAAQAAANEPSAGGDSNQVAGRLWTACRSISRPQLESLAQRIVPVATWGDLILPALQSQMLRQLAAQARNRMTVYEQWGFAARGRRGLGLSALFSGPSGTGKTLAAEVLATELQLDLYRVDLASVVSRWVGETEKNLRQVFDAAEAGGVILLFDEADAIFGKRSEVKDSQDRYSNIEVSYLLQRMESFQGLAILTTNAKSALDKAFQRRLRFSVDFPFPGAPERQAIWQQAFPPEVPTEGLRPSLLANLNMAGGNIRNIALNAAFLAAEQASPVKMTHVMQAAQFEAVKVERPVSSFETKGWV